MKCNVGKTERIIRGVVGLAVIGWGVSSGNWFGALGVVLVVTAALGWCPLYIPFGINTCKATPKV